MPEANEKLEKLAEKLDRVADLFKQVRTQNRVLERDVEKLRNELKDRGRQGDMLARDIQLLRREREEIRTRIQRLVDQIDRMTKPSSSP